jgi:3-hydroxyacyl-CoA dehydrogenase
VGLDRGKLTEEQYDFAVKNMALPPGMHELCKDTDVIIECIPKFLALKMRTFKELVVTL